VVARHELPPNTKLGGRRAARALEVRQVPARFVPPDALASPSDAVGLRTAATVAAGGYVTVGLLESGRLTEESGPLLAAGERAVEVAVAGGDGLSAYAGPGARVDVIVTTNRGASGGRTFVALENVELLDVRPTEAAAGGEGAAAEAAALATLRVDLRQAVYLTAAHNFAREVRLLARSPRDRRRSGGFSIDARGL
jgi:pilus assembly protein CpaB